MVFPTISRISGSDQPIQNHPVLDSTPLLKNPTQAAPLTKIPSNSNMWQKSQSQKEIFVDEVHVDAIDKHQNLSTSRGNKIEKTRVPRGKCVMSYIGQTFDAG